VTALRRRPVVLMYHAFRDGPVHDPYDLHVDVDDLRAQLASLAGRGWRPLDLDGYLAACASGRASRRYLVTIDDGCSSVADLGAPALARAGVPSVLFVPPALLGRSTQWLEQSPDVPILAADRLAEVAASGMEIGVHGWAHEDLPTLGDAELRRATREAREYVADLTGTAPRAFAHPYGYHDARVRAAVQRAGYTVGFSVYDDAGPFAVSRVDVKPADTVVTLRAKLVPGYRLLWRTAGRLGPLRSTARRLTQAARRA
jgi:peptidoglycan/xylan/chitin deacetylase (PgdA/CDA1 family)